MTSTTEDTAPPCEKCAHYKHDATADPINRDLCMIGPVNCRYQRTENCFGRWFVWGSKVVWPKSTAKSAGRR